MPINWTVAGNMSKVEIRFSYDNGVSWKDLALNEDAVNGTWDWVIATDENVTNQGKINITDKGNANTYDLSTGCFSVKGNLTLATPSDTGIIMTYTGGNTYNITWTMNGTIPTVQLLYSVNNGGDNYPNLISNETGSNLTYEWTVPDAIGYDLAVKIRDLNDDTINDTSNNPFAIKGSMLVTYPNGGEDWVRGTADYVNWTPTGTYSGTNAIIEYDNGTGWNTLGEQAVGNNGTAQSFDVTNPPDDLTATAKVRVTTNVTNASINVSDDSNATFRIIGDLTMQQPDSALTWYYNESEQIQWYAYGTISPMKIELSTDGGLGWSIINGSYTGAVEANNIYNWTVPDKKNESQCLIRITHNVTGLTDITDQSSVNFTIFPAINVTQPVAGQQVFAGSTNTPIRWTRTSNNTITNVDIY
jgi:hypothetical protein